ncbi:MAG TPA: putative glycolipid-binding domain-containing protein [Micromonosporaceae bacterium]
MAGMPKALMWRRLDAAGAEQVLFSDRTGLHARGTILSSVPVPFTCRYELFTDESWATTKLEATVEGAGFVRTARLERAAGRWRVTASEQGDLDASLRAAGRATAGMPGTDDPSRLADASDVDLGYSPLTNTLPIRRLRLREADPGRRHEITVAWLLPPGLQVIESTQTYTVLDRGRVRYTSGSFSADLTVDDDGFIRHYPGLADRV